MRITPVRHATLLLETGGHRLMVDPMLDPPAARAPVRGTPNERPNPLVPLPLTADAAVEGVQAVLLPMVQGLGPVSGFVVEAPGEPTVYVAGETVWCDEVAAAIEEHRPDWIVVNAAAARFLEGRTITMDARDVAAVARAAPGARIVAVHIEAINHCLEGRAELAVALAGEGLAERVAIPADGDALS